MAARVAACALVLALLAGAAAPGAGGVPEAGGGVVAAQETPTNETVRHEDPDAVDRRGDLGAVERHLAGRLGSRLGDATVAISEGEYERARSLLGDGYDDDLARYVDVAGATPGESDDAAAESFREAGNRSTALADAVASFESTEAAYRRAVERGDTARARELGRRLIERSRDVERAEGGLDASLRRIEEATGRETGAARERVGSVAGSVAERADAVAGETFVRTRLAATAAPTEASFLRPTTVRGRLVAANGSAIPGARVLVGSGRDAAVAVTNATGGFAATYRPVATPADAGAVAVRFDPPDASGYLGARANATVSVSPVTPRVALGVIPDSAAYGDVVTVTGAVRADGVPVPDVPVVATVDGAPLVGGSTAADGNFVLSAALPASVPDGNRTVRVRVDQAGRAVGAASASAPVAVERTPTTLTLAGAVGAAGNASVSGRLRTVDGRGLAGRTVRLAVDGEPAGSVETDGAGRFSTRLDVGAGNATVTAAFDGTGSSLSASSASMVLSVPGGGGGGPPWAALGAVGLVAGLAFGAYLLRRRGADDATPGTVAPAGDGPSAGGEVEPAGNWRDEAAALIESGETDAAVERAYAAARARLSSELDAAGALTHWEFYGAAVERLESGRLEALRGLTEAYERARFAPVAVGSDEASAALERVEDAVAP